MTRGESSELLERVVRLEVNQEHSNKIQKEMQVKVNDIHEILQKAKGAKWFVAALVTVGSTGAAITAWLFSKIPHWNGV